MLAHGVERRLEKIGRRDAGNFDGILKGQKNTFARPDLRRHRQQIFALIGHVPAVTS